MKVKKSRTHSKPDYPSARQFDQYKKWVGLAAIGLGAVAGFGEPVQPPGSVRARIVGKMTAEPKESASCAATTNAPAASGDTVRLGGDIAVTPRAPGLPPLPRPASVTNQQAAVTYVVKQGETLSGLAGRFLGHSSRWPDLVALNPGVTPQTLKAGQKLVIPAESSATNKPAVSIKGKTPK